MSLLCRNILEVSTSYKIKLLGGSSGIDSVVKWVYVAEAMESIHATLDWINGGEIVIITGSNLGPNPVGEINTFLENCKAHHVAGVIINTGRYINRVPAEAIALADRLGLPLFEVPWETRLVDLTRDLCAAIINHSIEDASDDRIWENLLAGNVSVFDVSNAFLQTRIDLSDYYSVGVFEVQFLLAQNPSQKGNTVARLRDLFKSIVVQQNMNAIVTYRNNSIIFLLKRDRSEEETRRMLMHAIETMHYQSHGIRIFCGVGKKISGVSSFSTSYYTAQQTVKIILLEGNDAPVLFYEEAGPWMLLLSIHDTSLLKDYYMNLFTAILSHDRINNGQLMQTLRTYMACNAKLAATAKTLYIHENTLKYRLNKIESLLNMNIHELNTQFRLKIGFMIGDLLGLGRV